MNQDHLNNLSKGKDFWNKWRKHNSDIEPDFKESQLTDMDSHLVAPLMRRNLRGYDLSGANFWRANLRAVDFSEANLSEAHLNQANLEEADLTGANLQRSWIEEANLCKALLHKANLSSAELWGSNLSKADCSDAFFCNTNLGASDLFKANFSNTCLRESNLMGARLVETNFENADLEGSSVWGVSAWDLNLKGAIQSNLIVTPQDRAVISVDDLEIAQFIYILLSNQKIRKVIDTITSKVVLILGRFTPERKAILDTLREELRSRNYLSVVFDFEKPSERDLTETVSTLAHLSRFVIADITDAKSIPQELQRIVPSLPSLPIQPIILDSQHEYSMFQDFGAYSSVLPPYRYRCIKELLVSLDEKVIAPALKRAQEIAERRRAFEANLK
ncbi:pentapeptide repeat-containing protein [Altericista sp. CCNU0014]|uniref:pentapeptide repeat-containing protein n=1 Tax=Altericista sp. CCNU0014 TaxID=3082949 RepID=UPI00384E7934